MPVLVREMDDDTATIIMVDSNQQRENLMPSEKAFSYKMKLEAMKRVAGRPKENGDQVGHNFFGQKSIDIISADSEDSQKSNSTIISVSPI